MRAAFVLLAFAVTGCLRKDYPVEGPVVEDVDLLGAEAVDADEVLDRLSTAASPRFLGIWDGVLFEYEVFDEALLARDLERIERFYRARGYYEAKVTAARILRVDEHRVRVQLHIYEGVPVIIKQVTPVGLERIPIDDATDAILAITLKPGQPFDEAVFEESKRAIVNSLGDHGFAFAKLKAKATVDIARHEASVRYEIDPGAKAVYGPVRIAGLDQVPEGPVRANLEIKEGEPYSRADLEDARAALINLGVFATVDITQDKSNPETGRVPITVVVHESALRTLRLGGGTSLDVLAWEAHLTIGWEHRNFLGGMRRLTLDTKPGLVFYPTRMDNLVTPRNVLPKNSARAELRQPAFIEGRTTGFVASEFNIYPVLYPGLGEDPTAKENVIGFYEVKARTGVERAFFAHHLYLTPSLNWQANVPFPYIWESELPFPYIRDKTRLETVYISYPELVAILDFRDDPIEPHRGAFLSNTFQVAVPIVKRDYDPFDVKVRPEARAYLPIAKEWILATRVTFGLLFPKNYGDTLKEQEQAPDFTDPDVVRDQQLLLFRAFYSGGPNSNRGYPYRGVGPHGVVGFLLPSTFNCAPDDKRDECIRPLGGLTLWEASLEVRFPILGPLRSAVFLDASDVTNDSVAQIRFTYPHLSPGVGLRYGTPVGPIRLDVGYRLPFAQHIGHSDTRTNEGRPSEILGAPIAVHFGLGEAF